MSLLNTEEALAYLEKKGIVMSKQNLIYHANNRGFKQLQSDGYHHCYDTRDLDLHLVRPRKQKVPIGWISIKDFCDKHNQFKKKAWKIYAALKEELIEHKIVGGISHIKEKEVKEYLLDEEKNYI